MTQCTDLEAYLDKELPKDQLEAFETHLGQCPDCALGIDQWSFVEDSIQRLASVEDGALPDVNDLRERRIVTEFKKSKKSRTLGTAMACTAAAAALVVVAAYVLFGDTYSTEKSLPEPTDSNVFAYRTPKIEAVVFSSDTKAQIQYEIEKNITVPSSKKAILQLGEDSVGLSEGSSAVVVSVPPEMTQIDLMSGTVVAQVKPRTGGNRFVIKAGAVSVTVVGTLFRVERKENDEVVVAVTNGIVDVKNGDQAFGKVEAGKQVTIPVSGEPVRSSLSDATRQAILILVDPNPGLPELEPVDSSSDDKNSAGNTESDNARGNAERQTHDLDELQSWIISGRLEEAQAQLNSYIVKNQSSTRAWSLMADCMYRGGNWKGAVSAHKEVISRSSGRQANTARFRTGVILQEKLGRHKDAIEMFDEFYREGGAHPLKAASRLRSAKSHIALGRRADAQQILKSILSQYPGTTSALEAARLVSD